jgi:hypothetical protein
MAQMGAAETLARILRERTTSLFDTTTDQVQRELARLGTPTNFAIVARQFFARLAERYLMYFLSRESAQRLGSVEANREFREALSIHCHQASKIVQQFAADWFSKANYQGGITHRKAAGFIAHALTKLRAELQKGAEASSQ